MTVFGIICDSFFGFQQDALEIICRTASVIRARESEFVSLVFRLPLSLIVIPLFVNRLSTQRFRQIMTRAVHGDDNELALYRISLSCPFSPTGNRKCRSCGFARIVFNPRTRFCVWVAKFRLIIVDFLWFSLPPKIERSFDRPNSRGAVTRCMQLRVTRLSHHAGTSRSDERT